MIKDIKTSALIAAVILTVATPALAVDVKTEAVIEGPVGDVWSKIGGWCSIKEWHPAFVGCDEMRKGENLHRVLTLGDGAQIFEKLTGENENSYTYVIEKSPLPLENYKSTISVSAEGDDKTKVTWVSTFDAKGKPDAEVAAMIKGVYDAGLQALQKDMMKK